MKIQLHTPDGIVERDMTVKEIDRYKETILGAPGILPLIEAIEDKFLMVRGTLQKMVKDKIGS